MKVFDYDNIILGEKIFGLEINDDIVKVLELKRSGGKVGVVGFGKAEIEKGFISDDKIVNHEGVADAIRNARSKARPHKIKQKYAAVVLPDSKIFVRVITFPAGMTKEEIREAVQWKAKDLIAMPLNKVYWDWHRLKTESKEGDVDVAISAVQRECVDSYTKTLKLLNITPIYYDLSGNAAARFLFQQEYHNQEALLVRIDKQTTTLSLFLNGGVRFQSVIKDPVKGGYENLVDLVVSKLTVEKQKAQELLFSPDILNEQQKESLKQAFVSKYDYLTNEITQIIEYHKQLSSKNKKQEPKGKKPLEIFIYGKGAKTFYLQEYLSHKSFNVGAHPESDSSLNPTLQFISHKSLIENLVILGMSSRNIGFFKELRDINLVPKSIKTKYLQRSIYSSLYSYLRIIFWDAFVICVALGVIFSLTSFYKKSVEKELTAVNNIAESQANKELSEQILELNQTAVQVTTLLETQLDWEKFFQEISQTQNDRVVLNNILITEDQNAWKAVSGEKKSIDKPGYLYLVISGISQSRSDLQQYVFDMESSDMFEEVKMTISSFEEKTDIDFTIYCFVKIDELLLATEE